MDCEMPILDGYEATKKVREIESAKSESRDLPVLIVGLSGNEGD
jgi:CheY-like chemotaxis protein